MKIFLLGLAALLTCTNASAQEEKTYHPDGKLYYYCLTKDSIKQIEIYYPNGNLWAKGILERTRHKGEFQEFYVYHENGKIHQYYSEAEKVFTTYFEDGKLKLHYRIEGEETLYEEFYQNGVVKVEKTGKKLKEMGICVSYSNKHYKHKPNIRICSGMSTLRHIENHPNGKPCKTEIHRGISDIEIQYFDTTGNLVVTTNYLDKKPPPLSFKYYHNGQMEEIIINYKDSTLKKQWYENGNYRRIEKHKGGKLDSCLTDWYENGNLKAKRWYADGQANGPFITYHENGRVESMGTSPHGLKIVYNNKGQLIDRVLLLPSKNIRPQKMTEKGENLKSGERNGTWTGTYENGKPAYTCEYKNGFLHGEFRYYDTTGELLIQCHYHEGFLHGKLRLWDIPPNGIYKLYNYNMGKLEGLSFIYDAEGNLLEKTLHLPKRMIRLEKYHFKTLALEEKTTLDSLGSTMKKSVYKDGKPHHTFTSTLSSHPLHIIYYYPNGTPKEEKDYYENGKVKNITKWDENGNLIESRIITEEQHRQYQINYLKFAKYMEQSAEEDERKRKNKRHRKKKKLRWL